MCFGVTGLACSCLSRGLCAFGSGSRSLMKKETKIGYGIMLMFFSLVLFVMLFFLQGTLAWAEGFIGCPSGDTETACLGISAVYRYELVLF